MKHVGDITKIHGYDLEPVDVIVGGSPCQDLSVAGKRKGIQHSDLGDEETTRSGLFMEQIRIIKEMRYPERYRKDTDKLVRPIRDCRRKPRFAIWENVPGAFSSGTFKGADFAAVLEEFVKIECPDAPNLPVPKEGWQPNGCIYDELGGWSIAWTVHDAAKWCVPQRRKRISLVADFAGLCAPEILFERKGLSRDFEQSEQAWQGTAGDSEESVGESNTFTLKIRGGAERDANGKRAGKGALIQNDKSGTIGVSQDQTLFCNSSGGGISGTIDAHYYLGTGARGGVEREFVSDSLER